MTRAHRNATRARGAIAAAGLAVLALVVLLGSAPGADEETPHGVSSGCVECHEPAIPGQALVFVDGGADASCLRCHATGPHSVGSEPKEGGGDEHAALPKSWPLAEGKLACLTCHDEPACDNLAVSEDNPYMLRDGPHDTIGTFCAVCHTVEQLGSYDPHEDMVQRPEAASVCEFCHQDANVTEADMDDLKVAAPRMCEGCHRSGEIHAGSAEHLVELDDEGVARAQAAGLPLDDRTVFCGTCHDPHPAGSIEANRGRVDTVDRPLMPADWSRLVLEPAMTARGADPTALGSTEPDHLRLPLAGGQLCGACHPAADVDGARVGDKP